MARGDENWQTSTYKPQCILIIAYPAVTFFFLSSITHADLLVIYYLNLLQICAGPVSNARGCMQMCAYICDGCVFASALWLGEIWIYQGGVCIMTSNTILDATSLVHCLSLGYNIVIRSTLGTPLGRMIWNRFSRMLRHWFIKFCDIKIARTHKRTVHIQSTT